MPTEADVLEAVRKFIAGFTGRPVSTIADAYVLKGKPLKMVDSKLGALAITIGSYLRSYAPGARFGPADTRKPNETVQGLAHVAWKRLGSALRRQRARRLRRQR